MEKSTKMMWEHSSLNGASVKVTFRALKRQKVESLIRRQFVHPWALNCKTRHFRDTESQEPSAGVSAQNPHGFVRGYLPLTTKDQGVDKKTKSASSNRGLTTTTSGSGTKGAFAKQTLFPCKTRANYNNKCKEVNTVTCCSSLHDKCLKSQPAHAGPPTCSPARSSLVCKDRNDEVSTATGPLGDTFFSSAASQCPSFPSTTWPSRDKTANETGLSVCPEHVGGLHEFAQKSPMLQKEVMSCAMTPSYQPQGALRTNSTYSELTLKPRRTTRSLVTLGEEHIEEQAGCKTAETHSHHVFQHLASNQSLTDSFSYLATHTGGSILLSRCTSEIIPCLIILITLLCTFPSSKVALRKQAEQAAACKIPHTPKGRGLQHRSQSPPAMQRESSQGDGSSTTEANCSWYHSTCYDYKNAHSRPEAPLHTKRLQVSQIQVPDASHAGEEPGTSPALHTLGCSSFSSSVAQDITLLVAARGRRQQSLYTRRGQIYASKQKRQLHTHPSSEKQPVEVPLSVLFRRTPIVTRSRTEPTESCKGTRENSELTLFALTSTSTYYIKLKALPPKPSEDASKPFTIELNQFNIWQFKGGKFTCKELRITIQNCFQVKHIKRIVPINQAKHSKESTENVWSALGTWCCYRYSNLYNSFVEIFRWMCNYTYSSQIFFPKVFSLGHAITRSSPRTYKGAQRKTDNPSDLIRETKYPDLLLPGYQTCEEGAAAALTTELLDLAIP
ncbi:hypothetical protein Anapl_15628 [Anas platyrhynchos]|uniref:Uncharacterized protein n=1 Tax=Anas platyrhynchos TaxID=8839 RepID=R0J8J8_ANAPL|nr:hypothetical protein Anapl_15628 [Anas platyrhynchos]